MSWLRDTTERVVVTFLEAWLAAWLALPVLGDESRGFDTLFSEGVLLVGFLAAVGSALKALAAARVGQSNTASLADG
jgi:hypothetical protein